MSLIIRRCDCRCPCHFTPGMVHVVACCVEDDAPGFGWELSDETKREIAEIEKNSKNAASRAKDIIFD